LKQRAENYWYGTPAAGSSLINWSADAEYYENEAANEASSLKNKA